MAHKILRFVPTLESSLESYKVRSLRRGNGHRQSELYRLDDVILLSQSEQGEGGHRVTINKSVSTCAYAMLTKWGDISHRHSAPRRFTTTDKPWAFPSGFMIGHVIYIIQAKIDQTNIII